MRYIIFDPIKDFYHANKRAGYNELCKQEGFINNKWFNDKIKELENKGYTHNSQASDIAVSDRDYIVIDNKKKEWCWWECGFFPMCGPEKDFPKNKNLLYWAEHRK